MTQQINALDAHAQHYGPVLVACTARDFLRGCAGVEAFSIDEQAPTLLVQALDSWLDAQLEEEEETVYRDLAETLEATLIRRLLVRYDGKLARMASALKANRTTLRRRLQNS